MLTVASSSDLTIGQTCSMECEQITVTAQPTSTTITVTRGGAGTTAASHNPDVAIGQFADLCPLLQYDYNGAWTALTDAPYMHPCTARAVPHADEGVAAGSG